MSLTIRESLVHLAVALDVDPENMPTSNIADAIDYIANEHAGAEVFDRTGVIAKAVDNLSEGIHPQESMVAEGGE